MFSARDAADARRGLGSPPSWHADCATDQRSVNGNQQHGNQQHPTNNTATSNTASSDCGRAPRTPPTNRASSSCAVHHHCGDSAACSGGAVPRAAENMALCSACPDAAGATRNCFLFGQFADAGIGRVPNALVAPRGRERTRRPTRQASRHRLSPIESECRQRCGRSSLPRVPTKSS